MGIFDFFKKQENKTENSQTKTGKFTKAAVDDLILTALNVLCDDVSTVEDAKKLILSKGYDEKQAETIVSKANELYLKYFAQKK